MSRLNSPLGSSGVGVVVSALGRPEINSIWLENVVYISNSQRKGTLATFELFLMLLPFLSVR